MFQVKSGQIRITDPCYSKDLSLEGIGLVKALNGAWKAGVELSKDKSWGNRVAILTATHADHKYGNRLLHTKEIYVDSGQAGVFDDAAFPEGEDTGDYDDLNTFYGLACSKTHDENDPKVNSGYVGEMGFVSSSGYGDGGYTMEVFGNEQGEATKITITFIDDDYEEEDYEDDDYAEDDEELDDYIDELEEESKWSKEGDLDD